MAPFSRFLRYFMPVARLGSIRKASEELHISASAIDRQILLGEQQLGVKLFERHPAGLRLTTAGEFLLHAARKWTGEFATLSVCLEDLRGLRRGVVHLGIIEALTKGFVPQLIQRLKSEHPFIQARIAVLDNVQVTAAIAGGAVDLGIMLNPRTSRELTVRAHAQIQLGLVTPPKHALARQKSVRFSVCAEQPIVAPAEPLALCEQIRGLEVATGVTLNTVAASDNIHMIKSLITQGLGLGVLTWLDVADEVQRGELAFIPLAHASLQPLTLAVCIDPARQLSAAARLFLGWVETALTEFGSAPHAARTTAMPESRANPGKFTLY
jgi:DNA-binding transcriptional LysR family regulator